MAMKSTWLGRLQMYPHSKCSQLWWGRSSRDQPMYKCRLQVGKEKSKVSSPSSGTQDISVVGS